MTTKCVEHVHRLLRSMEEQPLNLPVIVGGVAANRAMVFNFSNAYSLPVYYGTDVGDAVEVLEKALLKRPVELPTIKEVQEMGAPAEILEETNRHGFRLFRIRISDILMDEDLYSGRTYS